MNLRSRLKLTVLALSLMAIAGLAWMTAACISASGGAIGSTCASSADCTVPYQCLPITPNYTCSPDAGAKTIFTCQQTCTSYADCEQLPTPPSYECSPNLSKCSGMDNAELCIPQQ